MHVHCTGTRNYCWRDVTTTLSLCIRAMIHWMDGNNNNNVITQKINKSIWSWIDSHSKTPSAWNSWTTHTVWLSGGRQSRLSIWWQFQKWTTCRRCSANGLIGADLLYVHKFIYDEWQVNGQISLQFYIVHSEWDARHWFCGLWRIPELWIEVKIFFIWLGIEIYKQHL